MDKPISTSLAKWGNSTGIRVPKAITEQANMHEGDMVSIEAAAPGVIIVRAIKPELTLDALVSQIKPQNRHAETQWGPPRGNEVW